MVVGLGILLAFGTAFLKSVQGVFNKWSVEGTDEYVMAWSMRFFALFVLAPVAFHQGIPKVTPDFWKYLLIGGSLNAIATILTARAFKLSDISLIVPIYAFSPVLLLITSPIILNEFPSRLGLFGVFFITCGAYLMKLQTSTGIFNPIKNLLKERGVQLILLVNVIHSVTSNIDKLGVVETSSIFWPFAVHVFLGIVLFPVMLYKSEDKVEKMKNSVKPLFWMGVIGGIAILLQMTAISLTLVVYVSSIKRMSIILTPILGYIILNEKEEFKGRLAGAVFIAIGSILIGLS